MSLYLPLNQHKFGESHGTSGQSARFAFTNLPLFLATLFLASLLPFAQAQEVNGRPAPNIDQAVSTWQSDEAIHVIGLTGIRETLKGSLSISPTALSFVSPEGRASIERERTHNLPADDVAEASCQEGTGSS